ncbi:MAG: hypothetical protein FXF49_12310 [Flexistipes sinusarabici]|uniref:Uncharacterized protein n=1 Tax=Flexistipes sinusarabici TaxID=2352 RepID=A0A5D0MK45_FLESI|nr:hypothetical protein [Flexistipes sinusarabici]TYB32285.1 MAG: hypothetical protein FXF49_12310 [Flexistipes sinusarabici]
MSEWRSRLRGLIPLLIIFSIIFSCVKRNDVIEAQGGVSFSVDYFITKIPEPNDETKLINIINSNYNDEIKNKAKILLGGYYYKQGEDENSLLSLQDTAATDNQGLNNAAYLWLASIYKFFGNEAKMNSVLSKIKKPGEITSYILRKTCEKGKAYCIKRKNIPAFMEKEKTKQKTESKETVKQAEEKEKMTDFVKKKQQKREKLKIITLNGNFDNPAFKGMLLAASRDNRTEILSSDNQTENSAVVDVENLSVAVEEEISFKIDYQNAIDELLHDTDFSRCKEIVIGVNDRFVRAGKYTKQRLMKLYDNITISNYETEGFKHLYKKPDNETVTTRCFLGIGREESMTSFVPLVRFVSPDNEGTEIYLVTDMYTGMYKDEDFIGYFGDVNIYTYIDTVYNAQSREFMKKYEEIYGKQPQLQAFIGYDMIQYIETKFLKNKENSYVSSISNISLPVVERNVHKIRIDNNYNMWFLFMPDGKQIPLLSIPAE